MTASSEQKAEAARAEAEVHEAAASPTRKGPIVFNFLGCFTLAVGVRIITVVNLIFALFSLYTSSVEYSDLQKANSYTTITTRMNFLLIRQGFDFIIILFEAIGLYGGYSNRLWAAKTYGVWSWVAIVLIGLGNIGFSRNPLSIFAAMGKVRTHLLDGTTALALAIGGGVMWLIVQCYFTVCAWSYYQDLREEALRKVHQVVETPRIVMVPQQVYQVVPMVYIQPVQPVAFRVQRAVPVVNVSRR
ncbi:hypothetical protein HDU67_010095 [Dinochytrium kinnereticum]|nr:hypothetical protein HDU67_010095 [Dinochytrium kinnereticum]